MELQLELSLSTRPGPNVNRVNNKDGYVVGWPPVRSWRKQVWQRNRRGGGRAANSLYVKVKMEGVGITRKIDLSLFCSHHSLANTLIALFLKGEENVAYKVMYQNEEGEWQRAKDVTWECFIKSVRRLKLEKNGILL
ncbi:auxin-responsive protein IAA20-like [Salvia hispanica]|uniref:auxin-responsive protein IAA20-like n=1 Tax=Salvia hispanica TaxID=49212 RepID=UPI002009112D|nr:auxin-responsive protein IAA20-like [Salvia hispanica]